MFKDKLDFIKLAPEIYVYHNFISKEKANELYEIAKNMDNDLWKTENINTWHTDKVSKRVTALNELYRMLDELFNPEYDVLPNNTFSRLQKGQDMYVHDDSPGADHADKVSSEDEFCTCHIVEYGAIVYINDDYTGGEIFYPEFNIEYKPQAGDLIIHNSGPLYKHGVKTVLDNTRYIY